MRYRVFKHKSDGQINVVRVDHPWMKHYETNDWWTEITNKI